MESPPDDVERERARDAQPDSTSYGARTTYLCPSQISDPQKLWGDPINYTNISTKLPTIPHLIQRSKSMEGERKDLGTLSTICSFLQTAP